MTTLYDYTDDIETRLPNITQVSACRTRPNRPELTFWCQQACTASIPCRSWFDHASDGSSRVFPDPRFRGWGRARTRRLESSEFPPVSPTAIVYPRVRFRMNGTSSTLPLPPLSSRSLLSTSIRHGKTWTISPKDERWASCDFHQAERGQRAHSHSRTGSGNLIQLPDQRVLLLNGAAQGSEGYGWDSFALNQSYARGPRLACRYFDPRAPKGSQWDLDCGASTIPRMYHSTATLLYDGSVFVAGSNPNVDVSEC